MPSVLFGESICDVSNFTPQILGGRVAKIMALELRLCKPSLKRVRRSAEIPKVLPKRRFQKKKQDRTRDVKP